MNIKTHTSINNSISCSKYNYKNSSRQIYPNTTFKGHFGAEKFEKNKLGYIIKETGFFRDLQTKNFVCDYIKKNFINNNKIKILIGGCSTGEELHTYNMLLQDLACKLELTGFDVSETSIKAAKSNSFLMQKIKPIPKGYMDVSFQYKRTLQDSFLAFENKTPLTDEQKKLKELFDEYFTISNIVPNIPKKSLSLKIHQWFLKWVKIYPPEFENKTVILNPNKEKNYNFILGDIMELDNITKGEQADVITFTNALYHILTEPVSYNSTRRLHSNAYKTFEELAIKLKKNLSPNGIFVLGEEEKTQLMDDKIIPTVLKKAGFIGLNKTKTHQANVWINNVK